MTKNFLKLSAASRENVREPKNLTIWMRNGASEFFGTLLLSILLAGATMVVYIIKEPNKADVLRVITDYLINPVIDGIYASFIAVGIAVVVFDRWSCDLNPAVSVYRVLSGRETWRYGAYKIVLQLLAGFIVGLMLYAAGNSLNNGQVANRAINTATAISKIIPESTSADAGGVWIFSLETLTTTVLLFSIFSPSINNRYRLISIFVLIMMGVWGGVHGGSSALNPARGLAQQVPGLVFGPKMGGAKDISHVVGATFAMLAGGFFAPLFYIGLQGFNEKYATPFLLKIVHYRDTSGSSYRFPRQPKH